MGAPTSVHQLFAGEFYRHIKNYIKKKNGNCIPLISSVDVQLDRDDKTIVQPDELIVCERKKVILRCVYGAGVREYWMVDPKQKRVLVYDFSKGNEPVLYGFQDEIPVGLYDGDLKVDMKEVFEELEFLYEQGINE